MDRDDEARRAGYANAAAMDAEATALEEDYDSQTWAEAGSPYPLEMWRRLRDGNAPEDLRPLTVKQAAARQNVSTKTIRSRLDALAAMDPPGAYREGRVWRIVPAALDALRDAPKEPPSGRRPRRKAPRPQGGSTSTRWTP